MRFPPEVHDRIAGLLEYPGPAGAEMAAAEALAAADLVPAAREGLLRFAAEAGRIGTGGLEELYTRTFDNCPERALEVGWQAFGETYARGAFLVGMRERLRDAGVPETGELPDHLGHVLRVLGRMPEETAAAFADGVIQNAVRKMIDGFPEKDHAYLGPVEAAAAVVASHVKGGGESGVGSGSGSGTGSGNPTENRLPTESGTAPSACWDHDHE